MDSLKFDFITRTQNSINFAKKLKIDELRAA